MTWVAKGIWYTVTDCLVPFISCWGESNCRNYLSQWGTVAVRYSLEWRRWERAWDAGLELENSSGFSIWDQRRWLSSSPREKLQRQLLSRQPGILEPAGIRICLRTPRPPLRRVGGEAWLSHDQYLALGRRSPPPQDELDFGRELDSEAEKNSPKNPCPLACANSNTRLWFHFSSSSLSSVLENALFSGSLSRVSSGQVCRLSGFATFRLPPPLQPPSISSWI